MENLKSAIAREDLNQIQWIISQADASIDGPMEPCGRTPLSHAAQLGKFESCKFLIRYCHASIVARNRTGRTALMEMIRERGSKWPKLIAELLASSVNEQDSAGKTAIMFAAEGAGLFGSRRGNLAIIRQLIDLGADLDIKSNRGLTVVGIAHTENLASKTAANEEIVQFLKDATIKAAALKVFHERCVCSFDKNGVLLTRPR